MKNILSAALSIFLKIEIVGRENFDVEQKYVVVANHSGWLDPILLLGKLPQNYKVALFAEEESAQQQPFIKKIIALTKINIISVDRSDQTSRFKALKKVAKLVGQGSPLMIFPEGRINQHDAQFYPFYKGSFFVAKRNGCPIMPVTIRGAEKIYFRRHINIAFGEPIPVDCKDNLEDIAIKTYTYMHDTLLPSMPKNNHKNPKCDITTLFIGELAAPPENPNAILADGSNAYNIFHDVNQESKENNRYRRD